MTLQTGGRAGEARRGKRRQAGEDGREDRSGHDFCYDSTARMNPRAIFVVLAAIGLSCAPPPPPAPKPDPTREAAYGEAVEKLRELNRNALAALGKGARDDAGRYVQEGEPASKLLLSAPEPTLAAMEAVSDRDQIYAGMLMANRHWSFARQLLVKNQLRWKYWKPRTQYTEQRQREAERGIAECDKRLMQP